MPETPSTNWEEAMLSRLAAGLSYPVTPDIAAAVRARLAEGPPLPVAERRRAWAPLVAGAVTVLLLTVALTLAVSRNVREAVADFLGLAVPGEEIHLLPTPAPGVTPTPFPTPRPLDSYATPTTLDRAAERLGFAPVLPPGDSSPAGVYVLDYAGAAVLVLQYKRFDLWETDGAIFQKFVFSKGTQVLEELTVKGQPAYWIAPGSHIVRVIGADGKEVAGSEQTVTRNTLVWQGPSRMNYRLETELSKEEAVQLAETLP
jgi:hypothetical protein